MGSVAKVFKKAKKVIKKPISKITKGIARGIAKVGKSVMKGVAKLNKKLGPIGMIGLSIAMPYAMSALGGGASGGLIGLQGGSTGWMNSTNTFLRSIGQVGNHIRTGYQSATGAIGKTWSTITKSISNGFQKFAGNFKGQGNIWSRISQGAKNLFNSARNTVKKFTPKFRQGTSGSVDVYGLRGNVHGEGLIKTSMKSADAVSMLQSGAIDASQISGQSLGSTEGWFTHAGSSEADKVITETINSAMKDNVNLLQGNSRKYFDDLIMHQKDKGIYINDAEAFDTVINSKGTTRNFATDFSTTPDSYSTNLAQTGDYTLGTARDKAAGTYNFTGGETYNNPLGKKYINKKTVSSAKKAMFGLGDSLLAGNHHRDLPEPVYAVQNDMTMNTQTGNYSGTNLKGAYGTDYFNAVFGNAAWEKLKNNYKYMNIT